jgi:hypothetical protein
MAGLSTQQKTMSQIYETLSTLGTEARKIGGEPLGNLSDAVFRSTALCIQADFHYREAERLEQMGLVDERSSIARGIADRYNTTAINGLTEGLPLALAHVRSEFSNARADSRSALQMYEDSALREIASADFKGQHAGMAARIVRAGVEVGNTRGITGACDEIDAHAIRFADIRRERPNQNDPIVAVFAAIANLVGTIGIIVCLASRSCSATTLTTFFDLWFMGGLVFAGALLIVLATL